MKSRDLLAALQARPMSLHIQDVRAHLYSQMTALCTFGFPTTSQVLLKRLRVRLSKNFLRNTPHETLAEIYAAKYIAQERYALEMKLDGVRS